MTAAAEIAASAGTGVGGGIAAWSAFKFLRWLLEFIFTRLDIRRSQLGQRLGHVEQELDAYREATMLLLGVVARLDANNPALLRVAALIRSTAPRATLDVDEIIDQLKAMP